jgi:hypothetical protein
VQETLGWNDRLFVTGALRVDNNSAFGEDFRWITYPKADVSWVVSEEPFWQWHGVVNSLRVRAAYGASGRAPNAFAALRTFTPVQGPGGTNAVAPGSLGNPNLRPERGTEIEAGFEAGLLERLTLDFTYYSKRTVDGIISQTVAPSSGFPGSVPMNLGRIDNSGYEVQGNFDVLNWRNIAWQVTASYARHDDVIRDLGQVLGAVANAGAANRVGYPIGGLWSRRVLSADLDANGRAINVLCDDGSGGGVACTQAPFQFIGSTQPTSSGAVANTVRLGRYVRLYGLVDFKSGHVRSNLDDQLRCTGLIGVAYCDVNHFPERFTSREVAYAATTALQQGYLDYYYQDASFLKLREVSATLEVPERWRAGLSRASLTLAGRELGTRTNFRGLDPENSGQAIMPPLSRVSATLSVEF